MANLHGDEEWNVKSNHRADVLSVLRASKQLYSEARGDLYRNRTLTTCFDNNKHSLLLQRLYGRFTEFYINLNGVCVARDFANLDFAVFSSLRLEVELPSDECSRDKLFDLRKHIEELSRLVREWQQRKYGYLSRHWCPKIGIDMKLHKETQSNGSEDSNWPSWEVCLDHVRFLLCPLVYINGVEDVTMKVHFKLSMDMNGCRWCFMRLFWE
ncbi:MAG: hypothetical protein Q9209_003114 [Squamulea sp. 1 TL-2023]